MEDGLQPRFAQNPLPFFILNFREKPYLLSQFSAERIAALHLAWIKRNGRQALSPENDANFYDTEIAVLKSSRL